MAKSVPVAVQSWRLVFDAASGEHPFFWEAFAAVLGALAAVFIAIRLARSRARLLLIVCVSVAALGVSALSLVGIAMDRARSNATTNGKCVAYEGTVRVLRREPRTGHAPPERIQIGPAEVEFSYFSSGRFYHQTIAYGGALVDETYARICVFHGRMVRVEVANK
jgi:hypothetical protein